MTARSELTGARFLFFSCFLWLSDGFVGEGPGRDVVEGMASAISRRPIQ